MTLFSSVNASFVRDHHICVAGSIVISDVKDMIYIYIFTFIFLHLYSHFECDSEWFSERRLLY